MELFVAALILVETAAVVALAAGLRRADGRLADALAESRALRSELASGAPEAVRARNLSRLRLLSDDDRAAMLAERCRHCGAIHVGRACPRVESMRYRMDGGIAAVTYWADNAWPQLDLIWPTDLYAVQVEADAAKREGDGEKPTLRVVNG